MTIKVTKEGLRWIARFAFDNATKDRVKAAGFRFDWNAKLWYTLDAIVAAKFNTAAAEQARAAIEASKAQTSDLDIPAPSGLAYLPFQKAGIAYMATRQSALCADEMGLGKTIQALGAINADPSIKNVLVICPASLKLNWQREARKWLIGQNTWDITICDSVYFPPRASTVMRIVRIINYDVLRKQRSTIDSIEWDLLICDESHYVKNPKAQRTHMVFGKIDRENNARNYAPIHAKRRIFLTGTPILNRPIELWPLLHSLDPQGLGRSKRAYELRYCAARHNGFGWDTTGASNLSELQARLRSSIMVRRRKDEVLLELPPKRRQIIMTPLSHGAAKAAIERERRIEREAAMATMAARAEVNRLSSDQASAAYKDAVANLRKVRGIAFERISKVRHETALVKVPDVVTHTLECLESVRKLVLWAHHRDVIAALDKGLVEGGIPAEQIRTATGEHSVTQREAAKRAFQDSDSVRVIICSIMAMGTGHDLWAASHEVFGEMDWTPGIMCQAEDRCHRIGQRNSVLVQHVVLDGSLDGRMVEVLVKKQEIIEAGLDGGGEMPDFPPEA